jgi:hypothetical protein
VSGSVARFGAIQLAAGGSGFNLDQMITRVLSLATILVALKQL